MLHNNRFASFIAALALVLLSACSGMQSQQAPSGSLYQRLGGLGAIRVVVDDFVAFVAADARINARFAKTDVPKLKLIFYSSFSESLVFQRFADAGRA